MVFGLTMVWAHLIPGHASLPWTRWHRNVTLAHQLQQQLGLCTFVQLKEDAQHVPLSKEGHLSAIIDGIPRRNACRCLHQLEVCQLLQCEGPSGVPQRIKWGPGASDNLSIRSTSPRHEYTW